MRISNWIGILKKFKDFKKWMINFNSVKLRMSLHCYSWQSKRVNIQKFLSAILQQITISHQMLSRWRIFLKNLTKKGSTTMSFMMRSMKNLSRKITNVDFWKSLKRILTSKFLFNIQHVRLTLCSIRNWKWRKNWSRKNVLILSQ